MDFLAALKAAGGLEIVRELDCGCDKLLCYTKFSHEDKQWQIG